MGPGLAKLLWFDGSSAKILVDVKSVGERCGLEPTCQMSSSLFTSVSSRVLMMLTLMMMMAFLRLL